MINSIHSTSDEVGTVENGRFSEEIPQTVDIGGQDSSHLNFPVNKGMSVAVVTVEESI